MSAHESSDKTSAGATQTATFGAGCFWGVEAEFRREPGVVLDAAVGYSGGTTQNPRIRTFAPTAPAMPKSCRCNSIRRARPDQRLLEPFWEIHDPTTRNRQGPDVGSQYRSVVFYHSPLERSRPR